MLCVVIFTDGTFFFVAYENENEWEPLWVSLLLFAGPGFFFYVKFEEKNPLWSNFASFFLLGTIYGNLIYLDCVNIEVSIGECCIK